MTRNWKNYLYIVTIIFFVAGFINITFSLLGFICFILPFVLLYKDKKKTWCQQYCPRAKFFSFTLSKTGNKKIPAIFLKKNLKTVVLYYFGINLFFATMSTIMVSIGRIDAIDRIRFLIMFQIPWEIPQLIEFQVQNWILHLSYRVYSMMFTSTIIGIILGVFYKPRTWCTICPVNTLSTMALSKEE